MQNMLARSTLGGDKPAKVIVHQPPICPLSQQCRDRTTSQNATLQSEERGFCVGVH